MADSGRNRPNRPIRPRESPTGRRKRRVVIDTQAGRPRPDARQARERPAEARPKTREVTLPTGPVTVPSGVTVRDLSQALGIPAAQIIKFMMGLNEMVQITQSLSDDAVQLIAAEVGREINIKHAHEEEEVVEEFEDAEEDLAPRPPVVTIMGQVDHDSRKITFLDTPGHEAFTAMRARGAKVTDIAVLVVAADDGVMPQTLEAIDHARAAKVPIVVAVNKVDKPDANPDRVKTELSEHGVVIEEYGGDVPLVPVSARERTGIEDLIDTILIVADVQELKANPKRSAVGTVVEAEMDKGRGPVATVLVQTGTLRIGDTVIVGDTYGRVRALETSRGDRVSKAGP